MSEFVVIAFVGVIVLVLVFWKIFKGGKKDKANRQFLTQAGLINCPEKEAFLEQTVAFLEQKAEYSYSIDHPMKTSMEGRSVYFYTKNYSRRGRGSLPAGAHEFLITLKRKVAKPFVLYCKPSSMSDGMGVKLLKTITTANWGSQTDDLFQVELTRGYSSILGVLEPQGSSFPTLIDPSILSLLTRAGDYGILGFRCREDKCSFDNPGGYLTWDFCKVWSFVQQLVQQD